MQIYYAPYIIKKELHPGTFILENPETQELKGQCHAQDLQIFFFESLKQLAHHQNKSLTKKMFSYKKRRFIVCYFAKQPRLGPHTQA